MIARRVLVVDDNRQAADSLAMVLRHWGYEVRVAYDGAKALELALLYLPRVMILDIELPVMNGFDVARHLRSRPALDGLLLLALTGHDLRDLPQDVNASDFDHYLRKPLHFDHLQRLLAKSGVPGVRSTLTRRA
jgi:CheY-like chemotaxis protein